MLQKASGTKFLTLKYRSTTKPSVGNWHEPRKDVSKLPFVEAWIQHTIADDPSLAILISRHCSTKGRQRVREVSGESISNSQVELYASGNCVDLTII